MKQSAAIPAVVLALAVTGGVGAAAQSPSPTPAPDGRAFFVRLVDALQRGDRRWLAGVFRYPFRIGVPGFPYPMYVENSQKMIRIYDEVFNPAMRCAIEESRAAEPGQPPPKHALLLAEGVVSMADGRVVAERTSEGFRITRMTLVVGARIAPRPPQRVAFEKGQSVVRFSGRLEGDASDVYILGVKKGQLLDAAIERFPGRALALRMVDAASGRSVNPNAGESARSISAVAPGGGDYRIEVVRHAAFCDPAVTYQLAIGLR